MQGAARWGTGQDCSGERQVALQRIIAGSTRSVERWEPSQPRPSSFHCTRQVPVAAHGWAPVGNGIWAGLAGPLLHPPSPKSQLPPLAPLVPPPVLGAHRLDRVQVQLGVLHHAREVDAAAVLFPAGRNANSLNKPSNAVLRLAKMSVLTTVCLQRAGVFAVAGMQGNCLDRLQSAVPARQEGHTGSPNSQQVRPPRTHLKAMFGGFLFSRMPKPSSSCSMSFLCVSGLRQSSTMRMRLQVRAVEMTCARHTVI